MKKLLLLCMIMPLIGISQSIDELMKVYGNAACAYWSMDEETYLPDEMLFNGGDIDIRSSDVSKVKFYKCDCFEGEMFESSAMILLFHVYNDGSKQLSSIEFRASMDGTMPKIYFDLNRYLGGDD